MNRHTTTGRVTTGSATTGSATTGRRAPAAVITAVIALALALAPASALALELEVDPTGGPLVLEERAEAAVAVWREAGLDIGLVDRRIRIRYGAASLLGPDVPVLVATSGDPGVDLELLVHPDLLDAYPGALVHAFGLAFGGTAEGRAWGEREVEGVVRTPTADDVTLLVARLGTDPADLDGDGVVDFEDLLILRERFGQRGVNLPGDLDGDGVVDERDLERLRARYTFTPLRTSPPEGGVAGPSAIPEVPAATPAPPRAAEPAPEEVSDEVLDAEPVEDGDGAEE